MAVRPLAEADIPHVAALYSIYMRGRKGPPAPSLIALFRDLYFANPFTDPDFPSLVYDTPQDGIVGFIGGNVRKMSICGRPIRVVFGGNLIVRPDYRAGLAAPRLLNTFMATNYDLAMTDSANNISRRILQRMGYDVVPALNIHWRRPLRLTQYGIYGISVSANSSPWGKLARAVQPLFGAVDAAAGRLAGNPFRQAQPRLHADELDLDTLLNCITEFRKGYSMWTEYTPQSLRWLIQFMEGQTFRGSLRKVVLKDESGNPVGWYIYYARARAVGEVVQIGGHPNFTKDILDHLFWDAQEHGVIGLHGVVDSRHTPDFSDKGCFFTCRGGWTVAVTRHNEIMRLLERGDAFLSRLDGEWALDPGE